MAPRAEKPRDDPAARAPTTGRTRTLRSSYWDGDLPQPGDILVDDHAQALVVVAVAEGPGLGQWRIEAEPRPTYRWTE